MRERRDEEEKETERQRKRDTKDNAFGTSHTISFSKDQDGNTCGDVLWWTESAMSIIIQYRPLSRFIGLHAKQSLIK